MNYLNIENISYTALEYMPNYDCSNILLIDKNVEKYQEIVNSVNSNTMAIVYSYLSRKEDLSGVLNNFVNIDRIAFAFSSNPNNCPVTFLDNQSFFHHSNISFLIDIFNKYNTKNADYLACNTLQYEIWDNYYNTLTNSTTTIIGASNNKTGNLNYGGDWLLENTSENIESIYFTNNIEYYTYLLDNTNWAQTLIYSSSIISYNNSLYIGAYGISGYPSDNDILKIPINTDGTAGTISTWYTGTTSQETFSLTYYDGYMYTSGRANDNKPIVQIRVNPDGTAGNTNTTWISSVTAPFDMKGYNSRLYLSYNIGGIKQVVINSNGTAGLITNWYTERPINSFEIYNSILYGTTADNNQIIIIPINSDNTPGTITTYVPIDSAFSIAIHSSYLYTSSFINNSQNNILKIPINSNGSLGVGTNWKKSSGAFRMTVGQGPDGNADLYVLLFWTGGTSQFDISQVEVLESNICFVKGTPVLTDQGIVEIQNITNNNTINNIKVKYITQTIQKETQLVCIKKDTLGENIPNQKTFVSNNHKLLYNDIMTKAEDITSKRIPYTGEILYNVLLEENGFMTVNNMICETLDINNPIAKLYCNQNKI
jgi:hypothetical protein